jgi:hypothetical protein
LWLVTVAPAVAVFTLCYRAAARRHGASMAFVAGAAWAATEFARVKLGIGDPFGLLGYSQVPVSSLVQIADVTGGLRPELRRRRRERGAGGGMARVLRLRAARRARSGRSSRGGGRRPLSGICRRPRRAEAEGPPQVVAVVQANLDLGAQWTKELYGKNLVEHLVLTGTR